MKSYWGVALMFFCTLFLIVGIGLYVNDEGITGNVVAKYPEDIYAPYLNIIYPSNGQVINESSIEVYGVANDDIKLKEVRLKINDDAWNVVGKEAWSENLQLVKGPNTIYVQAFDAAGNPSPVSSVTVYLR